MTDTNLTPGWDAVNMSGVSGGGRECVRSARRGEPEDRAEDVVGVGNGGLTLADQAPFGFPMAPSSYEMEPPVNPVRFTGDISQ